MSMKYKFPGLIHNYQFLQPVDAVSAARNGTPITRIDLMI